MKKLLTVSVLAIMAVSTANAEIASTGYVDKQTGAVDGAIEYTGKNYLNSATTLKAATESLDAAIKDVADMVGSTNVDEQIDDAIKNATINQGQVSGLGDALAGKQDKLGASHITDSGDGNVITGISAENGVLTVTKGKTLGGAAEKNVSAKVTSGDANLVTGDAVATAIATANQKLGLGKQDVLTPGNFINISDDNVITTTLQGSQTVGIDETSGAISVVANSIGSGQLSETVNADIAKGVAAKSVTDTLKSAAFSEASAFDASGAATTAEKNAKAYADGLADNYATAAQGAKADTALQKADITTGSAQGTISVKGENVTVNGLGSAAYTASTDYATSAQGALADSALQQADIASGSTNGTIKVKGTDVAVTGLTAVASMELPTECEKGAATCALVYDPDVAGKLKWEAIMK